MPGNDPGAGWSRAFGAARGLTAREALFVARAGAVAVAGPALLRVLPLPTALRWVAQPSPGPRWPVPDPVRIVELTDGLLRTDAAGLRASCVPRTLVLLRYLPAAGVPVTARFGARRGEDVFHGHAWIERDGVPWCESTDPRPEYRVMYSFPPATVEPPVRRTLPARAFRASHRVTRAALAQVSNGVELGKAVHAGLWLGALGPDDLVAVDEATYSGSYAYHTTDDHNLRGLFDWESAALERWFPKTGRLLVTSAGGGREVVALRRGGFEVDAFECNEALRASANDLLGRLGMAADVAAAPRDGFPPTEQVWDGVVVGWGSLTYLRGRERRRRFFDQLRARLPLGGPALLSFYARTKDHRRLQLVSRLGSAVARLLGHEAVEVGDVIDPVFQHYFTEDELRSELSAAGLELVHWSTAGFAHAVVLAR